MSLQKLYESENVLDKGYGHSARALKTKMEREKLNVNITIDDYI